MIICFFFFSSSRSGYDSLLPGILGMVGTFLQRIDGAEELGKEYSRPLYPFSSLYSLSTHYLMYRFCDKLIQGAARLGASPEHKELTKKLPPVMLCAEKHLKFHCVSYLSFSFSNIFHWQIAICCVSMGDFEAAEEVASFLYGSDNTTDRREQDTAILYLVSK